MAAVQYFSRSIDKRIAKYYLALNESRNIKLLRLIKLITVNFHHDFCLKIRFKTKSIR